MAEIEINKEKDCYFGVPTILNNKSAALKVCWEFIKKLKQKTGEDRLFDDRDFGPRPSEPTGMSSIIAFYDPNSEHQKLFNGCPDTEEIEWMRTQRICRDEENNVPQFLENGAKSYDVVQGRIGNCWFVSSLSILATREQYLVGYFDEEMKNKNNMRQPLTSKQVFFRVILFRFMA
jgi:hypothetical protein